MDVEYYQPDDEQKRTVATASWDGREVTVASEDASVRESLAGSFRRSPVVVDDPSLRRPGAAAPSGATDETGLTARFVPGRIVGGFDPAANYRRFEEQIERLDARSRS